MIDLSSLTDRNEIARSAGLPPFAVAEHLDLLARLGPRFIERALSELRRAEATIKTSSTDSLMVLQMMLSRMFSEPAKN
jgi:DNA polymerase III delta subunit